MPTYEQIARLRELRGGGGAPPPPPPPPGPPPLNPLQTGLASVGLKADPNFVPPPPPPGTPREMPAEELQHLLSTQSVPLSFGAAPPSLAPAPPPEPPPGPPAGTAPTPGAPPPAAKRPTGGGAPAPGDLRGQTLEETMKADQAGQSARDQQTQIAKDRANEGAALLASTAAENDARIKADEAKRAEENAQIEQGIRGIQARVDELAATKIDSTGGFGSADLGTKVTLGLNGILGGILGVFNGTNRNQAVENLDKQIDRNIRAQETDLATKKGAIEAQRGILAEMQRLTGSKQAGRDATRVAILQNAKMQFEARMAKYDAPEYQAKADEARAAFDKRIAEGIGAYQETLRKEKIAANAAARAAAESNRRWEAGYRLDAAKVGLEADRNNISRDRYGGGAGGDASGLQAIENLFADAMKVKPDWTVPGAPESLKSEGRKQWEGQQVGLVNLLRGQGDSDTTTQDTYRSLLPKPGDSPETAQRNLQIAKTIYLNQQRKLRMHGGAGAGGPGDPGVNFTPVDR